MIQQEAGTGPTLQASPSIIKINSDHHKPKTIWIMILFSCIIWLILIFYNSFAPNAHQSQQQTPCYYGSEMIEFANYDCQKEQKNEMTNPRALYIENYIPAQLFLLVQAKISFKELTVLKPTENITFYFSMWEVSKDNETLVEIIKIFQPKNRSKVVNCHSNDLHIIVCEPFDVVYIPQMSYKSVLIIVEIVSEQKSHLLQLQVTGISTSMTYTYLMIAVRYTFMILSIISSLWYALRLYRLPSIYHVIEQKMILVLSILLIFYDDPLYAITMLAPNQLSTILGIVFLSNFYAYSLLFQMVMADRLVNFHENGGRDSKAINWIKFTACTLLWVCILLYYSIIQLNFFSDPLSQNDQEYINFFIVFQVISVITEIFILLFTVPRSDNLGQVKSKLQRYENQECLMSHTFQLVLALNFDNYNSQQYQGTLIFFLKPIINLQLYLLQYLWAPSLEGLNSLDIVIRANIQSNQNKLENELDNGRLVIEEIKINGNQQPVSEQMYEQ